MNRAPSVQDAPWASMLNVNASGFESAQAVSEAQPIACAGAQALQQQERTSAAQRSRQQFGCA